MKRTGIAMLFTLIVVLAPLTAQGARAVFVNGARLPHTTLAALEAGYGRSIPDGLYWYDARSGLWGRHGGPALGQIHAGLNLGGRLPPQASNGDTDVYVNGRRLPRAELSALEQLVGPVEPGRYWLDAAGNAGLEGGPVLVNVIAAHRRAAGDWNRNTPAGNWGGAGRCSYYSHPDGPSVMIGDC